MLDSGPVRWRQALGTEVCAWASLIATFSYFYVCRFGAPWNYIGAHLAVLAGPLAGFWGLRMLTWRSRFPLRLKLGIVTALITAPLLAAFLFYLFALLGLSSWGRVTTWPLITSYAAQTSHLSDILGIPGWALPLGIAVLIAAPTWIVAKWWAAHDWTRNAVLRLSHTLAIAIPVTLVIGGALQAWRFTALSSMNDREPLGLAFLTKKGAVTRQHHSVGDTHMIDEKEARSRSTYRAEALGPPRNVVLIIGDALRADHMGVYGYARNTTPFLSNLYQEGKLIRIRRARSICAESACGLMGIAASRAIHQMPNRPFTLHEVLRLHGYHIHMILGGDHTNFYGLKEVYGPVDSYFDGNSQRTHYINDDRFVVQRLETFPHQPPAQRTMFQFHLMSTHGLGQREQTSLPYLPSGNYYGWVSRNPAADSATAKSGVNYYDNGMHGFDHTVNQLLDTLGRKGYLQDALVVITGDHGEELGDHGYFGHARQANEAVLTVPLLFMRYGYSGQPLNTRQMASQLDIAPTIVQELGVPQPSSWDGLPLQRAMPSRLVPFQQSKLAGIYDVPASGTIMKYWKNLGDGSEFAFAIDDDPHERNNLVNAIDNAKLRTWRRAVVPAGLVIGEENLDFQP